MVILRIIGGRAGGLKLKTRNSTGLRPTKDRVREALFNILGQRVRQSRVLDLFAGTGSIGIEALSRGAEFCIFIDIDRRNIKLIRENLKRAGFSDRAQIYRSRAGKALEILAGKGKNFDLIYCDPPYRERDLYQKTAGKIFASGVLAREGLLIFEHGGDRRPGEFVPDFEHISSRTYGQTVLSFFRHTLPGEEPEDTSS